MEVPKQNEPQESIDANESSHLDRSEYPVHDNTEKQPKRGLGFQRVVD